MPRRNPLEARVIYTVPRADKWDRLFDELVKHETDALKLLAVWKRRTLDE